jgi:phenylacetate-CoA ligase
MIETFDQFLTTFSRTERLPPRELSLYHQQLLARLVRHAYDRVPFYRDRLRHLITSDGEVDLRQWNSVPFLSREDVIAHGRDMRVAGLPAEYGEIVELRTSGSTGGVPLQIAVNGLVAFVSNALLTRTARRFDIDTSHPLAMIIYFGNEPVPPYPEGGLKKGWSQADSAAPCYQLHLTTPIDQQLEWLARTKPSYLLTAPSNALGIGYSVTPEQGRALGIEVVIMVGETVPDGARETIAERLGARAVAIYGCQEIGHIASECEVAPRYHVAVENALVEIVNDEGRDVAPGGRGRIILTGLYNYAMPFIRYEIGDVAVAGTQACACGRTLPVIERIVGRTRNAFVFRDGTRLWPRSFTVRPMHAFVPFRRYQLVQLDHETIEFRYESDGSGREPDLQALNAYARQVIHPSVSVRLVAVERLPAGPSGKLEEFISNVSTANASR